MDEPVQLRISALAYGGNGVARTEPDEQGRRRVVFVTGGLPGELVEATITARKPNYMEARVLRVLEPADERVEPPCPYFAADGTACGGCQWQHLNYEAQLRWKHAILVEQLQRQRVLLPGQEELVAPVIGMIDPWAYRSSVRFALRADDSLGYRRGSSHRVMPIAHCPIIQPGLNEVLADPSLLPDVPKLPSDDPDRAVAQYMTRVGDDDARTILGLPFAEAINPSDEAEDSAAGMEIPPEVQYDLARRASVEMTLLGEQYRVSAGSFFQVNTRPEEHTLPPSAAAYAPEQENYSMAELLVLLAVGAIKPQADDIALDAYSGAGTFALLLSEAVNTVYAIESNPLAYGDATHNTRHRKNIRLIQDKVERALPRMVEQRAKNQHGGSFPHGRIDKVIVDPPRSGCARPVLNALLQLRPLRIAYVSCDPSTLARDLRILTQEGLYQLTSVVPLDMFPQSYHIECVAALEIPEELL